MLKTKIITVTVASAILLTPCFVQADEQIPFPKLRFEEFCKELVSKMLNKSEQARELVGCLAQEFNLIALLEPAWSMVPPAEQQSLKELYSQPRKPKQMNTQSYTTLRVRMTSSIGTACIRKVLVCAMP